MKINTINFIDFTLQACIIWSCLFFIFKVFLSKSKLTRLNRSILLTILGLPFAIPFIDVSHTAVLTNVIPEINLDTITLTEYGSELQTNHYYLTYIYFSITTFLVFRIIKQIYSIQKLTHNKQTVSYKNENFYIIEDHTAFNFFNQLFIGEKLSKQTAILDHEILHKKAKHSFDIILLNILQAIFWIFPLWKFIKQIFKENHEYYVDQRVLKHTKLSDYLKQITLAGPFKFEEQFGLSSNQMSIFKTRLQMMKKNHKSQLWRYGLLILSLGTVIVACDKNEEDAAARRIVKPGEKSSIPKPEFPPLPINPSEEHSIAFSEVDVYPQFKGCSSPDASCFQQEMMNFISQNFKYPEKAKANNISGKAYVGFNYSTTGEVTNIALRRKTDSEELNKEALRLVKLLPKLERPAMKNGNPVAINYTLPIVFRVK